MKTYSMYFMALVIGAVIVVTNCRGPQEKDEKIGKAGDQFDLFAVMSIFQSSGSPESFEKSINSKSTGVNNLDLNDDGETDYIRVEDHKVDDNSHAIVLQAVVADGKTQDIAVIEVVKTGDNEAHIQIIGDKELYGSDYIVEPKSKTADAGFVVATTFAVNVWAWPCVAFIYSPAYVVWVSPYYYAYYPVWWDPWPIVAYEVYYPIVSVYHVHYQFSDGYRFVAVHENYHNNYHTSTNFAYNPRNYGTRTSTSSDQDGKDVQGKGDQKVVPVRDVKTSPGKQGKDKGKPDMRQQDKTTKPVKYTPSPGKQDGRDQKDMKKSPSPVKQQPGQKDVKKSPPSQSPAPRQPQGQKNVKKPQAPKVTPVKQPGGTPQGGKGKRPK